MRCIVFGIAIQNTVDHHEIPNFELESNKYLFHSDAKKKHILSELVMKFTLFGNFIINPNGYFPK